MKTTRQLLAIAAAAAAALGGAQIANAESTYGYSAAGAGTVSATVRVNVQVTVPKLIMLRVGSSNTTVDTVAITLAPSTPAAPVDGNSQAFAWDGTAPTFTASAAAGLNAYAWSNTDATLTGSVTTAPGTTGLTAASITVASTGTLAHPGADTGTFTAVNLSANTLYTGTWTYGLAPAATPLAGTYSQEVTYTATSI